MADWNQLDDDSFREQVQQFLQHHYPTNLRYPTRRLRWHEIRDWYLELGKSGWLAPNWPVQHGGMGLTPSKLLVLIEEQERWGVARTPDMGITMVGPLLIQHGSDRQRQTYLPEILSGNHIWCQGYSEPNAGSDLASLRTEAMADGDEFVVTGQKTWTTLAQDATHMFALVRTDKTSKKQGGISFLLIDLQSPGITVRPIRNVAGEEEFCEVFLDAVRVPHENLVGGLNQGWLVAKALLSFERVFFGSPKQAQYLLNRLALLAINTGMTGDPVFQDKLAQLALDVADLESLYGRFVEIIRRGEPLGPDVSILKIWSTETSLRIANLMQEAAGSAAGTRLSLDSARDTVDVLSAFYNARSATIYSGTNEIQRNIIAKSVLGLPN